LPVLVVQDSLNDLSRLAIKLGAADAKSIKADDIVVSDWVRLKCQYGCDGYGKRLTCPPYSPKPEEFRGILESYESAMLLRFEAGRPTTIGEAPIGPWSS